MRIFSICCLCIAAACGADPTLLSREPTLALATDASDLYWWRLGPEELRASIPFNAPGRTLFASPGAFPRNLLLSATDAIFADNMSGHHPQSVIAVRRSGGSVRTLASADSLGDPAIDDGFLYFFDPGQAGIFRTPLAGAGPTTRISDEQAEAVAVDSSFVYFSSLNPPHIGRVAKLGGPAETLVSGESPRFLAIDESSLYWPGTFPGVRALAKKGGTATDLLALSPGSSVVRLAVDATSVFCLCDDGTNTDPPPTHGALIRIPKDGSAPSTLASNIIDSNALAVGEGEVFWSDESGVHHVAFK